MNNLQPDRQTCSECPRPVDRPKICKCWHHAKLQQPDSSGMLTLPEDEQKKLFAQAVEQSSQNIVAGRGHSMKPAGIIT